MGEVKVVTEALRKEAGKWTGLSDQRETVSKNIQNECNLAITAFWCGQPLSLALEPTYREFWDFMHQRCSEGFKEFDEISGALKRAADEYDGSDEVSAATLKKIYGS
jgi:uncharacterized protein YukE